MKTVFINGSPKKKFSASAYFLSVQKFFVKGEKVKEVLRNKKDYDRILNTLKDGDNVTTISRSGDIDFFKDFSFSKFFDNFFGF